MKKLLLVLGCGLLLVGCGKKETLNLDEIQKNLQELSYNNEKLFVSPCADTSLLEEKYGMNLDNFESIAVCLPPMSTSASMYAIFKPKNENGKKDIDKFVERYKASWVMDYLPEEKKLVEDMKEEKYGDYYIYIVSRDNNKALETIKQK